MAFLGGTDHGVIHFMYKRGSSRPPGKWRTPHKITNVEVLLNNVSNMHADTLTAAT